VELPPAGSVQLRDSDNRELDKLVAALGRNKATWRRALALHEWLLQVSHQQQGETRAGRGVSLSPASTHSVLWLAMHPALQPPLSCSRTSLPSCLPAFLPQINYRPDDRLCTTLIRVCAQHGQAATALSLYDWMRASREDNGGGLIPTVFTYTAAMRAALTGSMMDRALQVRLRMAWGFASQSALQGSRPACAGAKRV
jgi:pentatricopeptide repeat protein